MIDELIYFRWEVDEAGYEWLETKAIDQPTPPESMTGNETEDEVREHRAQEILSRPKLFLISSVAPDGIETVSPDDPISKAVPVLGSTLSTFNVLILLLHYLLLLPFPYRKLVLPRQLIQCNDLRLWLPDG